MLSEKMTEAFNRQVNAEFYSGYLYLSMSAWFESQGLNGFASWMRQQTQEELFHGMKMFDYVIERGGRMVMDTIARPRTEWVSVLEVFTETLAHEEKVTGLINDLVNLAMEERDHASTIFLQWFVSEQVEEEATAGGIVDKLKLINNDPNGIFMLDRELGQRVFTVPTAKE